MGKLERERRLELHGRLNMNFLPVTGKLVKWKSTYANKKPSCGRTISSCHKKYLPIKFLPVTRFWFFTMTFYFFLWQRSCILQTLIFGKPPPPWMLQISHKPLNISSFASRYFGRKIAWMNGSPMNSKTLSHPRLVENSTPLIKKYQTNSDNMQQYPTVSNIVQQYSTISNHIQPYPTIIGNIWLYLTISETVYNLTTISDNI